jgi:hypothetical protein
MSTGSEAGSITGADPSGLANLRRTSEAAPLEARRGRIGHPQ